MAKVHKAHKSSKKYSFQRKHFSGKALAIILVLVIAAAIGLKIVYDDYVSGEIAITVPSNETLNNIAANWRKIEADTTNFMNPYAAPAQTEEAAEDAAEATDEAAEAEVVADGTDGQGGAYLVYVGNEKIENAYIYVNAGELNTEETAVEAVGMYGRTTLSDFINGVAPWGKTTVQLQMANANCYIVVNDTDAENLDESAMVEILAAAEAALAAE